jgi:hypothetical protein
MLAHPPAPAALDAQSQRHVTAARAVTNALLKGIKQIGLYRHADTKFADFLNPAHQALATYGSDFGTLQLKVELTNFSLHGVELFDEGNPISYRFFKDGIRQILFRPGFTLAELVTFTMIALSDPDRGAEDINAQLWRAQMPHFEHIMVHGFRMDEFSEEEIQVEVDKIVDYLQRRLRSNNQDYLRFATISEDDLNLRLDDVEQMRGSVIAGTYATPTLKATLQKEIEEEETLRLFPKLVAAVFALVEEHGQEPALISNMLTQLLDAMLIQEDFVTIHNVVARLKSSAAKHPSQHPLHTLLKNFIARMGEEARLIRIADILRFSKLKQPSELKKYLAALSFQSLGPLLEVLAEVQLPANRAFLLDVLVPFAEKHPEPFIVKLQSNKPQLVRDMISVLDRSNHPDKIRFFESVLQSDNLTHKLEVMAIIAKGKTGEARNLIARMLHDASQPVRMQAARVLPAFGAERAMNELLTIIHDKAFEKRELPEKEAFFAALGSTGTPGALTFFEERLETKAGLLNRKHVLEDKMLAIVGLAGRVSQGAVDRLTAHAQNAQHAPEVRQAARHHAQRITRALSKKTSP